MSESIQYLEHGLQYERTFILLTYHFYELYWPRLSSDRDFHSRILHSTCIQPLSCTFFPIPRRPPRRVTCRATLPVDSIGKEPTATIKQKQINMRLHKAFSPLRVNTVCQRMEVAIVNSPVSLLFNVHYRGKWLTSLKFNC